MQIRDIIGQGALKREMCRMVEAGKIPHALLLSGAAGVGKLPLALALAQYIACPHRTESDSCGVCPTCLQYGKLQHPDLHFVFPIVKNSTSDTSDTYVNDFRQMVLGNPYCDMDDWTQALGAEKKQSVIYDSQGDEIERKLRLKAFGDGYKTAIVWQPEKMNETCANKLLKLLEEPPEQTLFIFVSEHPEMLLPTIISRLRPVSVPRLTDEEIVQALTSGSSAISREQALDAARLARGSYREAMRVHDEDDRTKEFFAEFCELMRNAWRVGTQRDYAALQNMNEWVGKMVQGKGASRERQCAFLQFAQRMFRENFISNYGEPQLNYMRKEEQQFAVKFAPFINERNIETFMEQFSTAERQIAQNANAKMVFFDLCLQCIVLIKK